MHEIKKRTKKNGNVSFTACIRVKGYNTISKTFDTKAKAQKFIKDTEARIDLGLYCEVTESSKHTLSELIERFKQNELSRYKGKKNQKSISKYLDYFNEKIGKLYLKFITPSKLTELKEKLLKEPRGHFKDNKLKSPSTVNFYLSVLSSVLAYGVRCQWLQDNPMHKVEMAKVTTKKDRFLTPEEIEKLLNACLNINAKDYKYELFLNVLIAITTGARYDEILHLKWENIDLKNKVFYFIDTKNGESRNVPIVERTYKELLEFQKVRNIKSDYVFIKKNGTELINIRYRFFQAIELADIKNCRYHDLRHTVASHIAMNGGSLLDIAEVTGHKTMSMVKRYSHLTQTHVAKLLNDTTDKMFESYDNNTSH